MSVVKAFSTRPVASTQVSDLGPAGLSPESILAYCTSRLRSLDDIIMQKLQRQQQRNNSLKELGDLQALMGHWSYISPEGGDDNGRVGHSNMSQGLADLYNRTKDPDVKAKIALMYRTVSGKDLAVDATGRASHDGQVHRIGIEGKSSAEYNAFLESNLSQLQNSLSKDGELEMINIQSLVSQRQLAVQLTTQMMAQINESLKGIAGNIR
jgi:hypothetical protein